MQKTSCKDWLNYVLNRMDGNFWDRFEKTFFFISHEILCESLLNIFKAEEGQSTICTISHFRFPVYPNSKLNVFFIVWWDSQTLCWRFDCRPFRANYQTFHLQLFLNVYNSDMNFFKLLKVVQEIRQFELIAVRLIWQVNSGFCIF